jgi:hypothetical protein
MAFIDTVVKSAKRGAKWVKVPELGTLRPFRYFSPAAPWMNSGALFF